MIKQLNFFLKQIKLVNKFGSISSDGNKINKQKVNINISNFEPQEIKSIKKIISNFGSENNYVYDTICFFISQENEYVLGYIDAKSGNKSIIIYDVNNNKEIKKINDAHNKRMHSIKY